MPMYVYVYIYVIESKDLRMIWFLANDRINKIYSKRSSVKSLLQVCDLNFSSAYETC